MKVFVFDLLAYDANLDHLKGGESELPYPLAGRHFDAATAVRTYHEHLDAWELLDKLGYDGVGFNEHHCSPYGLMNSPNLMAAPGAASAPADLDPGGRQPGIDRVRRQERLPDHSRPRPRARFARRHHPLLREMPRCRRAPHHAEPPLARHHRLCRGLEGPGSAR